ncbi:hypothetical protein J2752_001068 [Halarchaeum rubridurum]|uniref:IclR helix-turn-helix domain-containing protein n=1 Tax=Halarchaeum rubridurum TaxID=489911 RepID=A0A830FL80_9EURY|nr:hypothetical protein [Halarchaeum rubridurum]MBP1954187.1 hypothetical protein [Halarchaeum rubridurum]GGM58007.1 hypothetical protein GCM10009017_05230 [Halarchaeum rubridurum]
MRHAALLVLAVALLATVVPAGTAVAQSDSAPSDGAVVLGAHVQSDGDARWQVSVRYVLNDSAERDGFERVASDFAAGDVGPSVTPFRAAADDASARTNRTMEIVDVTRDHGVTERDDGTTVGTLTLAFTWTNFANVTEDHVEVDDVFASGWLGDLDAGQTLRVYPPDDYRAESWQPSAQRADGALTWRGPQTFGDGGPQMVFVRDAGLPWYVVGGLVALALAAGVAGAYVWRGFGGRGSLDVRNGRATTADESAKTESPSKPGATGDAGADTTAETGATDDTASTPSEAADAEEPEELLSDEERVERLLRENGGRMKQGDIVSETKWSDAKVSQLLSAMAEEGRVEKLRIGRENLISLPDTEEP